jgi:tRNA pseudouridine32 synthase/23S rRNA pseudouridine746 synthase
VETVVLSPQSGPALVWQEHPDFVLAAKPAGMSFHTEGEVPGVVASLKRFPGGEYLHGVHRLDRMTSGLMICARNSQVAAEFGQMFEEGRIAKYYLALSDHRPAKKQGWIKGAMQRARGGNWRLAREGDLQAVTQFFSFLVGSNLRLFVVRPRTGRTHQIRVALKSLGAPILGDDRYGGSPADRGYLHANALCFNWKGESFCFLMPPGQGALFQECADQLPDAPWDLDWPV